VKITIFGGACHTGSHVVYNIKISIQIKMEGKINGVNINSR
jgi:hypothetical protein